MPEYHRGKARSPYRKRFAGVNLTHTQAGVKVQTLLPPPLGGTVETKSWRGIAVVHGNSANTTTATGWFGFYRGQLGVSALEQLPGSNFLAQSECFGVEPWTLGRNDLVMPMKLIGVTISINEALYFVSTEHFEAGNPTVIITAALMYAEKEVPA